MGNNVVVPDRQPFDWMDYVRLDATVQTILQQSNVNFKDNVATVSDLPTTWNSVDDFRLVLQDGWVYKWNWSSRWKISINNFSRFLWSGNEVNVAPNCIVLHGDYLYCSQAATSVWSTNVSWFEKFHIPTQTWSSWGTVSTNIAVLQMVVDGDYIYVAGSFTTIDLVTLNNVGRFNTLTDTWEAFTAWGGTWVNGQSNTLVVNNDIVYVWGTFTTAWWVTVNRIAKFDIVGWVWADLWTGANGNVRRVYIYNGILYVAGAFTTISGLTASRVAAYDIVWTTWAALWTGVNNIIDNFNCAMVVAANKLFIYNLGINTAGWISVNWFAVWDILWSTWSAFPWQPDTANAGFMIVDSSDWKVLLWWNMVVFWWVAVEWACSFDPTTLVVDWFWKPMASQPISCLAADANYIYASGTFKQMGSDGIVFLARYNKTTRVRS